MSVLKGERLKLRSIEKTDLEKLNEWKDDESVYEPRLLEVMGSYIPSHEGGSIA